MERWCEFTAELAVIILFDKRIVYFNYTNALLLFTAAVLSCSCVSVSGALFSVGVCVCVCVTW